MIEALYISQLEKKYADFLKSLIKGSEFQPIVLRGGKKKPGTTEELHRTIQGFLSCEKTATRHGWYIGWKSWNTRKFGKQRWPESILVQSENDLLFLLNKSEEAAAFKRQLHTLIEWNPKIAAWLMESPLAVLEGPDFWKDICRVVDYLRENDLNRYYIRSLPVPVHTKFLQTHEALILSILRFLEPERIVADHKKLEIALGLRRKPHLFPIRWLDDTLARQYTSGIGLLALPDDTLRGSDWVVPEVWVVENETNLYLLPQRDRAMALFSKGYALHDLKEIPFLSRSRLLYWGDLDEDGFMMLQQFRSYYPQVQSILMDEDTVKQHGQEMRAAPFRFGQGPAGLAPHEEAAYLILRERGGRIEQEQLRQDYIQKYFTRTLALAAE